MVTSKIKDLSNFELDFLNKLLHKELHENYPENASTLRKIIFVVESQQKLLTMLKW